MRIATRFRLISTVAIAAFGVLAMALVWSFVEFSMAKNDNVLAEEIKANAFERAALRDRYFLYREARARMQWSEKHEEMLRLLQRAERQFRGEKEHRLLALLRQNIESSAEIFLRIVNNSAASLGAGGNPQVHEETDKMLSSQLLQKAAAVHDAITALDNAAAQRVESAYEYLMGIVGLFAAIAVLASITTSMHLGRFIRKRVAPLHDGARKIADGDLGCRIQSEGDDEFAELAWSINSMTGKLQAFTKQLEDEIRTHKQVAGALRDSDERLQMALSGADMATWDWHVPSGALVFNARWAEMQGYRPQDIAARIESWQARVFADDLPPMREQFERHFRGEIPFYEFEYRVRHKSGHLVWVHSRGKIVEWDVAGSPVRVVGTTLDITDRKRVEEELSRSRYLLQSVIEGTSDAIYAKDMDGRYTLFNSAAANFVGKRIDEVIGQDDMFLFPADEARMVMAGDRAVIASGSIQTYEETVTLPTGEVVTFLSTKGPLIDEKGGGIGLFGVARDISERKRIEEKLHLAASVFIHAREAIIIAAADGSIIDVNDAFTQITGYGRDEVLGRNPRLLKSGRHEEDFYACLWRDLIANGHWYGEIWNRRKNGDIYAAMLTISAVHDAQGRVRHYVALSSDIMPLKEHELQLEHMAQHDMLTGLPNRLLLADRLHVCMVQAQRRTLRLAVAYVDLDGFKAVNDNHGHDAGDRLLVEVAARMKHVLREGDTLARLGGDEFVVVLVDLAGVESCVPMLSRLLEAAAQPVEIDDLTVQVSASVGVTFYPQTNDVDADQLLRQADQAMYCAKQSGKNRYHLFDADQARG